MPESQFKVSPPARQIDADIIWLNVHMSEHRLVHRDIADAYAFVGLFFSGDQFENESITRE